MNPIAVIFPGQGSQTVGMGKDYYDNLKECRLIFEEASDAIKINLKQLCFEGPLEELTKTEVLQPALFTVERAILEALRVHLDPKISLFAGHSLGEYSAIAAAGSLSVTDGVKLTALRGKLMQNAVPLGKGAMAAVLGLDAEKVRDICLSTAAETKKVVEPANFNSPGQVVISGEKEGVDAVIATLKSPNFKGVKTIPLQVSAPFHCSLMKPAQDIMEAELNKTKFYALQVPYIANYTAQITRDEKSIADLLARQITGCVRWEETMQVLVKQEIRVAIEAGPGKVLSGLMKRGAPNIRVESLATFDSLKNLNLSNIKD